MRYVKGSSDIAGYNRQRRNQALDFTDRLRPDGTMQGGGPLAPQVCTLPPCPHRLGFNCLRCYPVQYHNTNARLP